MTDGDPPDDGDRDQRARDNAATWIEHAPTPDGPVTLRDGVTVTDHGTFRASVLRRLRSTNVALRAGALDDARAYRRALRSS